MIIGQVDVRTDVEASRMGARPVRESERRSCCRCDRSLEHVSHDQRDVRLRGVSGHRGAGEKATGDRELDHERVTPPVLDERRKPARAFDPDAALVEGDWHG